MNGLNKVGRQYLRSAVRMIISRASSHGVKAPHELIDFYEAILEAHVRTAVEEGARPIQIPGRAVALAIEELRLIGDWHIRGGM